MKVFRDMFAAILLGIMGGLLVTTVSYYNEHKEGGLTQTLFAVVNSFDTVADAYSTSGYAAVLLEEQDYDIDKNVLETFGDIGSEETELTTDAVSGLLLSDGDMGNDILVMDDEDGNLEEGEPYSGILRFHVRANSDSDEDQELKLAVKEDVVTFMKPLLEDCNSVKESKNVIVANMQNIYEIAINTIVEMGYDYEVKVYVTEETFPAKTYGDLTFPAGDYQALRIDIGEAKGQNWWCVMYPPLCFIDETTMTVSQEGKEILQDNLTAEEYAELFAQSEVNMESWLLNWLFDDE